MQQGRASTPRLHQGVLRATATERRLSISLWGKRQHLSSPRPRVAGHVGLACWCWWALAEADHSTCMRRGSSAATASPSNCQSVTVWASPATIRCTLPAPLRHQNKQAATSSRADSRGSNATPTTEPSAATAQQRAPTATAMSSCSCWLSVGWLFAARRAEAARPTSQPRRRRERKAAEQHSRQPAARARRSPASPAARGSRKQEHSTTADSQHAARAHKAA